MTIGSEFVSNMASENVDISFTVPFVHRLRLTQDVFGQDQQALVDLLEPSGDRPARAQFWLDETLAKANPHLRQRIEAFERRHADRLFRAGNVQLVPGGETIKNDVHILERMLKVMHAADLDRRSYVVVIGGGAVLDAVGFAASIAHRGIRVVRLPTTTLAQADSGVGVKSGVNLFGKKNWIGSFGVPWGVINDAALLESLSDRDFRCGFAEVVKVALLKDPVLFEHVRQCTDAIVARDRSIAIPFLAASARLHVSHITHGGDPFEANEARPLDFGHWAAHRLESLSQFRLRHGEAVAIGVAIDTVYSSMTHGLSEPNAAAIVECLGRLGFSWNAPELDEPGALLTGLEEFRQHLGGRLTITLLESIGRPIDVHEVDLAVMRAAIERVRATPVPASTSIRV